MNFPQILLIGDKAFILPFQQAMFVMKIVTKTVKNFKELAFYSTCKLAWHLFMDANKWH